MTTKQEYEALVQDWKDNRSEDDFNGGDTEFQALVELGTDTLPHILDPSIWDDELVELYWNLLYHAGMRLSVPEEYIGDMETHATVIWQQYGQHGTDFSQWEYSFS